MSKENPDPKTTRATFKLLWDMWYAIDSYDGYDDKAQGSIISRYAHIIDDRINNSGFSRATETLKLFSTEDLENELKQRKSH